MLLLSLENTSGPARCKRTEELPAECSLSICKRVKGMLLCGMYPSLSVILRLVFHCCSPLRHQVPPVPPM